MIAICLVACAAFFLGIVAGIDITLKEMRSGYYKLDGKLFRVTMRDITHERD